MSKQWLYVVRVQSDFDPEADYIRATLDGHTDGLQCVEDLEVMPVPESVDAISLVEFKAKSSRQD